jgi:D-3-phosphoglycerate dehydrogenase
MSVRVLVAEAIAPAGVDRLRRVAEVDVEVGLAREALLARIAAYDALVVRSATRVDAELLAAGTRLRVVGRAGTGIDNVDVDAATARGVLVCNAPQSNMLSAAEHAIALLLALARNVPQAHAALRAGRWERGRFAGVEVSDKTLAVVGFGRIGQLVASRARGLGMEIVAYDPFVSAERFLRLGARRAETLAEAVREADFVTLHLPATADTRHVIDAAALAGMRPGVRIVNAARGDLVDTAALVEALRSGHVAGAALDVFEQEPLTASPLLELETVVVTPHLGASTHEAQDRAGTIIADQVARALQGELVENAVNVPNVGEEDRAAIAPFLPLAEKLGRLCVALADGAVERLDVSAAGAVALHDTRLVTLAVVRGALAGLEEDAANFVNARTLARERGIEIQESRGPADDFTNLVEVATNRQCCISGTTFGRDHRPWLVRALGYEVEIELAGRMLFALNDDRPGMVGAIGSALGSAGVNIANMNVSRNRPGGQALSAIQVDGEVPAAALATLAATPGIERLRVVTLDGD